MEEKNWLEFVDGMQFPKIKNFKPTKLLTDDIVSTAGGADKMMEILIRNIFESGKYEQLVKAANERPDMFPMFNMFFNKINYE